MTAKNPPGHITEREDEFCHNYAAHKNGARAARESGITKASATGWASQRLKKFQIQKRIKDLKQKIACGEEIGKSIQLQKLNRIFAACIEQKKLATALSAIKEQNVLKGFCVDRRRSPLRENPADAADGIDYSKVSDEDLDKMEDEEA